MTESAYEWGLRHHSCTPALEQRKALGPDKTQADWWEICDRGDWLIWQLERLPPDQFQKILPKLMRAIEVIVTSAIVKSALDCGIQEVEHWAARWLIGEDRSNAAARATASAARATARDSYFAAGCHLPSALAIAARAEAAEAAEAWAAAWAAEAAEAWAAAWAAEAVEAAWRAAAWRAAAEEAEEARAVELRTQANKIHAEIPEWPG